MERPTLHDAFSTLTGGALAAIGSLSSWIAVLVLLPRLLMALAHLMTQGSAAWTASRRDSMWTRHEDRLLALVDPLVGLQHLERVRRDSVQGPAAAADSGNEGPPQESPP
ncbi:hypothetical protein OHB33_41155 (plasmid) [Streptomyces sp. NBC_01558]|uniref:hypothetical protein n=1 Tax=Streptomyces sp. NBC_01558 TaxID=2975878 RepID=UPI002DD9BCE0|nr:hypothetical protein [Streptomyces sp. NBC_01558]WSD82795.1 hypothetical protein OHB33_41155 [Streptomyces sp. NBC_01558]